MRLPVRMKKCLGILLALSIVLQCVPATVFAAAAASLTESVSDTVIVTAAPEVDLPDNDELFAMYAQQRLYECEWDTFGTKARSGLNTVEQCIYDELRARIEKVAASGGSTEFDLSDITGLKMTWTNGELGVGSIEETTAVKMAFLAQFNLDSIVGALVSDCPFDLYWFDKTDAGGVSMSYSIRLSGQMINGVPTWTTATVTALTFTFTVASGYQSAGKAAVTANVAKVDTAKAKAAEIAAKYEAVSAYDRLRGYMTEICDLVSYNDKAAAEDYTGGYGDPWQLIYVFDGDSGTNVVCEGYAKAFQYLCDLGGLDCISVTGTLSGASGSGGHMWNIVTLEGANYLVDVTNCDEGAVGAPDGLFLVGNASGSAADGYPFTIGSQTVSFVYDTATTSLWTTAELTLADSDYEEPAGGVKGDLDLDGDVDADDLTLLARHVGGIELITNPLAIQNVDVNGDEAVDAADLTLHARYIGGIITDWDPE